MASGKTNHCTVKNFFRHCFTFYILYLSATFKSKRLPDLVLFTSLYIVFRGWVYGKVFADILYNDYDCQICSGCSNDHGEAVRQHLWMVPNFTYDEETI